MPIPKLSWSESKALDVSACYQMGKIARQRKVPKEDNPWMPLSQFAIYWDKGWDDEDNLINQ
jgi:hypothetical protein